MCCICMVTTQTLSVLCGTSKVLIEPLQDIYRYGQRLT